MRAFLLALLTLVAPALVAPALVASALVAAALVASPARAAVNPDGVAIVIGNRAYTGRDVPEVKYADRDAQAIHRYVVDVLGYDEKNVIHVENASLTRMLALFGTEDAPGQVARWVRKDGSSDLLIYYSGHGVPGLKNGQSYLLPVDADPSAGEVNGYALRLLYANLLKTPARRILVLLDACFAGQSGNGASLIHGASVLVRPADPAPASPAPRMTVVTASGPDQLANWDDADRHGLFTEYFLRAVYGVTDGAPGAPVATGRVTVADLHRFLDREMSYRAGREYGRDQDASVSGDETLVLAQFQPGRPPKRPSLAPPAEAATPAPAIPSSPGAAPSSPPVALPVIAPIPIAPPPPAPLPPGASAADCVLPKVQPGGVAAPGEGWIYLGKVADCTASAWNGTPHILAASPVGVGGRRHTVVGDSWLRMDAALPAGVSSRGWRAAQRTIRVARDGSSVFITRTELYEATDGGYALWGFVGR